MSESINRTQRFMSCRSTRWNCYPNSLGRYPVDNLCLSYAAVGVFTCVAKGLNDHHRSLPTVNLGPGAAWYVHVRKKLPCLSSKIRMSHKMILRSVISMLFYISNNSFKKSFMGYRQPIIYYAQY